MFIYLCGIYMERNNLERFGSRIFLPVARKRVVTYTRGIIDLNLLHSIKRSANVV